MITKTNLNPENIVCFNVHRRYTKEAPFFIVHKKGDIKKKAIKLFGFTIKKEERYTEDIFDWYGSIYFMTIEELNEKYNNKLKVYYEFLDGKWYIKPRIVFKMIDKSSFEKYFDSDEELDEYIYKFRFKYNIDIDNFINI